jgi:hypothetical protein
MYSGQSYVLVEAGPRQAATWHEVLPDLMQARPVRPGEDATPPGHRAS